MSFHFLSHLHKKQRVAEGEPHRHPDKTIRYVDKICLVFSVMMPLTTIPQIHMIYAYKEVGGISLLMWILYCIGVLPFLAYGILHKERQLIILNSLWLVMQTIVIAGVLMYR